MQEQKSELQSIKRNLLSRKERKTERFRRKKKNDLETKRHLITRINSKGEKKMNSYKWRLIKRVQLNRYEGFPKLTMKSKHQMFIQISTPK